MLGWACHEAEQPSAFYVISVDEIWNHSKNWSLKSSMPLATATWFDIQATLFGILLDQIGGQTPGSHFSLKKLKY